MATIRIPAWLSATLTEKGLERGSYSFGKSPASELIETVELAGLPKEFSGIASSEENNGLAVANKYDGVIYRFQDNEMDVFAIDENEFNLAMRRDEAWEELSENMPAAAPFWLGIILKAKQKDGTMLTLGFPNLQRQSALVIRGRVEANDMLADALNRDLKEALDIEDYQVIDLVDDGGIVDEEGNEEPLFTVVVEVPHFDAQEKIGDPQIGWMGAEEKQTIN